MATLNKVSELEPREVFRYFEEICNIPHGSGNLQKISDYLVQFAKEHELEYVQDAFLNVIINKPATKGMEDAAPVIIQGHMDMVAVKKNDKKMDMTIEGITPMTDGIEVWGDGTSLGGDDGIAVAYALAVLASDTIIHPALTAIFTTDEEVGMGGATAIDLSKVESRIMLNIDSEEEGSILVSCAGGVRVTAHLPIAYEKKNGTACIVTVGGLVGGHSGQEIDKEHGNANCIMGRLIHELSEKGIAHLHRLEGGLADNAIPRECEGIFIVPKQQMDRFEDMLTSFEATVKKELAVKDPGFAIKLQKAEDGLYEVLTKLSFTKLGFLILCQPNGVQAMSSDVKGLVQTSLNLGILSMNEEEVCLQYAVRSSVESEKKLLVEKMDVITKLLGGYCTLAGEYPGWEFKRDSVLQSVLCEIYQNMYQKELKVEAMHAGLECGVFSEKLPGLDCVSFGPDMKDIHTTEEHLNVASTKRTWEFLLQILAHKFN